MAQFSYLANRKTTSTQHQLQEILEKLMKATQQAIKEQNGPLIYSLSVKINQILLYHQKGTSNFLNLLLEMKYFEINPAMKAWKSAVSV